MERSGRNKWRSMRFLPWGEGLEGRQLLSGHGRRTSRMRNSKPCLTILSATRWFARTRRSSPMGASDSYDNPHGYHFIDPSVHSYNRNRVYNYISPHVY